MYVTLMNVKIKTEYGFAFNNLFLKIELNCDEEKCFVFFYIYMNIVLTNKYNEKLQSPGALNIKETPGYKQKDNLKNNK